MRYLLALLDGGTLGTRTEPSRPTCRVPTNYQADQSLNSAGTCGTLGTRQIYQADIAQRVDDLADAYHGRIAIVMEAGGIGEAEAESAAALEVGREFVRLLLRPISGPKQ